MIAVVIIVIEYKFQYQGHSRKLYVENLAADGNLVSS